MRAPGNDIASQVRLVPHQAWREVCRLQMTVCPHFSTNPMKQRQLRTKTATIGKRDRACRAAETAEQREDTLSKCRQNIELLVQLLKLSCIATPIEWGVAK